MFILLHVYKIQFKIWIGEKSSTKNCAWEGSGDKNQKYEFVCFDA